MKKPPQRKQIRLKEYDYSNAGYYFITICTKDRKKILSKITCRGGFPCPPAKKTTYNEEEP